MMVALSNIGGALCSTPQSLADAQYWSAMCSNAAKTRNSLKFAGVPQTTGPISAASRPSSPYCGNAWRRYCCSKDFFPIVDTCLSCEDITRQSCAMVLRWRFFDDFLHPVFAASAMQQVSDLHFKFALRPHRASMVDIQSATAEIRRGIKKDR